MHKRNRNEKVFGNWKELSGGSRLYWYDVKGKKGWIARYCKEVDIDEKTQRFYQEIYDDKGKLTEVHEKFPIDKGHKKI